MPDMQPHLLLCDINLCDDITGIELVAELKNSYTFETIFITSYQNKEYHRTGIGHQSRPTISSNRWMKRNCLQVFNW